MTTTKTTTPPILIERPPETPDTRSLDEVPPPDEDDPDTSRLLPARKRRQHRVRVQGRLAVVRSVSTADLKTAGGGEGAPGRRSADDEKETAVRDRQLRGYGIGGAGNIRRPTEVYGSRAESETRWWSLRHIMGRMSERKPKAAA